MDYMASFMPFNFYMCFNYRDTRYAKASKSIRGANTYN